MAAPPAFVYDRRMALCALGKARPLCHAQQGFSLLELLVVITIIAVLASLLMPAIKLVRDQAEESKCRNSMRQLGLAASAYATDNDGYKVASSLSGAGGTWALLLTSYLGTRENLADGMMTGVYNACPPWRRDPLYRKIMALRGVAWMSTYGNGYAINSRPMNPQQTLANDDWGNPWIGSGYQNIHLATIRLPTHRIFFAEHVKRNGDIDILTSCQDFFGGYGPDSSQPGAAYNWSGWRMSTDAFTRHRGGANYLFFDGHVERQVYPRSLGDGNSRGGPGLGHTLPEDPRWLAR